MLAVSDFSNVPDTYGQTATGICRTRNGYAWGFSFLLTFVVALLNLVFVLIMYGLWLDTHRQRKQMEHPIGLGGEFKDAVTMVSAAQRQYGADLDSWGTRALQKKVVKGWVGLGIMPDGEDEGMVVRRKKWESHYMMR